MRADTAGATRGLIDYCRAATLRFSVGYELTGPVRTAILEIARDAWVRALDQDLTATTAAPARAKMRVPVGPPA